jgi:hypothetical protein
MAAEGYQECIAAEDIGWESIPAGVTSRKLADALVEGWKNSPPHRKSMLDPDLDEIGIGVGYNKETNRCYGVQDFARPKSEEIAFTIANQAEGPVRYQVDGKDFTIQPQYTLTHHRCRPPALTFQLGEGAGKPEVFHPHGGSRYVVHQEGSRMAVAEED